MKLVLTLLSMFWALSAFAGTEILHLSGDKSSYYTGDKAVLRAMLVSKPDNSTMEFDVDSSINGAPAAMTRVTDFEFFLVTGALEVGSYDWSATVYLQDARLARDLKASISYFTTQIESIDQALAVETDPAKVAQLQASKARNQALLESTQGQLNSIRTRVYGPVHFNFSAN